MASIDDVLTTSADATGTVAFTNTRLYVESARSSSSLILGHVHTHTSSVATTSEAIIDSYALFASAGAAASVATPSTIVTKIAPSVAGAASALIATFNSTVVSSAAITSEASFTNEATPLVSAASATSSIEAATTHAIASLVSAASSSSSTIVGLFESRISSAAATSVASAARAAYASITSSSVVSSNVAFAGSVTSATASASADSLSSTLITTVSNLGLVSRSSGRSYVLFRDPNQTAYVINTETEALSTYKNFSFNSITYVDGVAYAACHDGFYELRGPNDDGVGINSQLVSGFFDMNDQQKKHVGSVYLGYTCDGPMTVSTETYGAGHAVQTNELDQRDALAPRNNRVKLGKGLNSRYWRLTIRNKNGSKFELNDVAIDVAVSKRRI